MTNMTNMDTTAEQQEKTFTQEQLNSIVGKRLAEQKQQYESDHMKKEQELNVREMNIKAKELLSAKQLPLELAEVLKYDNEEELIKAITILENARGFKNQEKPEYRVLGDNRLPSGTGFEARDSFADAFKLKG